MLDTAERGEVTHIGIRSTRLLTRDDVEVTIPNSVMCNTKIINESGGPNEKYRIRVAIGVAYGTDIDLVRTILTDIAIKIMPSVANQNLAFNFELSEPLVSTLNCWVESTNPC